MCLIQKISTYTTRLRSMARPSHHIYRGVQITPTQYKINTNLYTILLPPRVILDLVHHHQLVELPQEKYLQQGFTFSYSQTQLLLIESPTSNVGPNQCTTRGHPRPRSKPTIPQALYPKHPQGTSSNPPYPCHVL
jgi:hypothetical protein